MDNSTKSIEKLAPKYHCMVSGQKRMQPCSGCSNTKGCMSKAMQYKENEMNEKAVVKIGADGELMSCAKGMGADECGYSGGKTCGKCGAMAVMKKNADSGEWVNVKASTKKRPMRPMMDEDMVDDEDMTDMEGGGENTPADMAEDATEGEMEDTPMEPMEEEEKPNLAMARRRRLQSMGMKSANVSSDGFLCSLERKMHPSGGNVCANCPGGCAPEGGLPTILAVEGLAEEMFGGKVLDSGYGYNSDIFLVEMQRKDGKVVEILFDGTTAECVQWKVLNDEVTDVLQAKSALLAQKVIGLEEAAQIAVKSIAGNVVAVDADEFEGADAWVAEIDGFDGKSYDVYVSLSGEVLGFDAYSSEEAEAIEAEAAELALKRAYSDTMRASLAKRGEAMPDGSFPIKDEEDLRNAIQAFGRSKDPKAAKAHIMKRARDLGMEDLIPSKWMEKSADNSEEHGAEFLASLMEFEMISAETDTDTDNL